MVAIPSCLFTMGGVHRTGTDIPTITSQAIMATNAVHIAEPLVVTLAEQERQHQVQAAPVQAVPVQAVTVPVAAGPQRRRLGYQVQDACPCHALSAGFSLWAERPISDVISKLNGLDLELGHSVRWRRARLSLLS